MVRAGEPTSALKRGLDLLATFTGRRPQQSLSELSAHSGLPLTTTHRLVSQLEEWGALERLDDARYRVGLRLWEIATTAPRTAGLQAVAHPYMQDLMETTSYDIHLAVRDGYDSVFIERLRPTRHPALRPRIGARVPLHATAVGQVLLAFAPDEFQNEFLARPLQPFTALTVTDAAELRTQLAPIRGQGFAISDRQIADEYVAIAAPITSSHGAVVAALSLVFPHKQASEANAVHLVRVTARIISRALRSVTLE